jgi:hypothetical protein
VHAYCTYFDSGYLSRGLALIESLRAHGDDSPVWVLALDDDAKRYLDESGLPNVFTLTIHDIEAAFPSLEPLKSSRSRMEYYFTSTPLLLRWVLDQHDDPASTIAIYLDSDLFFFDDPALVLDELGAGSVGIIEHRYPPRLAKRLAKYGRFNVGWVGFRGDERGLACLDWWGASTLEWCSDIPSDGRYADQGYLDSFPNFPGVVVLQPAGFNLAPWNTSRHDVVLDSGRVRVDGDPLVFFHFHGLRRVGRWFVTSQLVYGSWLNRPLREGVYRPYVRDLVAEDARVHDALGSRTIHKRGHGLHGFVSRARKTLIDRAAIVTRNAIRADG